jgi:DNA polymerase (family 10)
MTNREIASVFKRTARLMELHGENEFKTRSLTNAVFRIDRLDRALNTVPETELETIEGIGKSISQKIVTILKSGSLPEKDLLEAKTPAGVSDILEIKGLGPKKVRVIWQELGIESLGELLYACNENRLIELKGFGQKTQDQVREAILFNARSANWFRFAEAEAAANAEVDFLTSQLKDTRVVLTGEIRRKCDLVQYIDVLVDHADIEVLQKSIPANMETKISVDHACIEYITASGIPVRIFLTAGKAFEHALFLTTGSADHMQQLLSNPKAANLIQSGFHSEKEFYQSVGLAFVPPECREGGSELEVAASGTFPRLLEFSDLKGCLHNHSTYSDGMHSLKQMATASREMGLEYFGICDHSKSAFYANGLQVERILQQHKEIDDLNKEMAPFRIFKGIESDILPDGSLDYDESTLASFDFVVASIHSGLRMDQEKATARLIKAIRNPFTTILGHPTGRLLLAREGYPVDMKAVLDECAFQGVAIELNANPHRLDLDWHWISYAMSKGVMISVNPDAHRMERLGDMYYGVCSGRKGMLTADSTLNCLNLESLASHFMKRNKIS